MEAIFDNATCRLHMDIPPIRSYNQVRVKFLQQFAKVLIFKVLFRAFQKDSESDYDDALEHNTIPTVASASDLNPSTSVKTELIDYSLPTTVPDIENISSVFGKSFPFEDDVKEDSKDESLLKENMEIKIEPNEIQTDDAVKEENESPAESMEQEAELKIESAELQIKNEVDSC